MEEPAILHPPLPTPPLADLPQTDAEPLPIPPFDDAMLDAVDLSFPDDLDAVGFNVDDYLDFDLDELEFAEDLLLDTDPLSLPPPGSDHQSPPPSSHPAASNHPRNPLPDPQAIEIFDDGRESRGQGFNASAVSNSTVNRDPGAPRVSDDSNLEHGSYAGSDRASSEHVARYDCRNDALLLSNGSIGSNSRSAACGGGGGGGDDDDVNPKQNHLSPGSVSCNQFSSSQGSGNCNSAVNLNSPESSQSVLDVSSSFNGKPLKAGIKSSWNGSVKVDAIGCKVGPKRKKGAEDAANEARYNKSRKPSVSAEITNTNMTDEVILHVEGKDEDEKRVARLLRNRESAQLSRQRKKQYVEELEDKVRSMHSTITDLNSKISYIMAENASLRQQLTGGAMCPPPPPPGMFPMAPMVYPWMPYAPYAVKPQGSQVPLVPIPRLKSQQPAPAPKAGRKSENSDSKKSEGKTKKVASISFLGLLFFILLFGGLVPMINVRYGGGIGETANISDRFREAHKGRILIVDGHHNRSGHEGGGAYSDGNCVHKNGYLDGKHCRPSRAMKEHLSPNKVNEDRPVAGENCSEPLIASLYVPRNDKLVQIDGNLIIHSVLASEKAMASGSVGVKGELKDVEETGLAIAGHYAPTHFVAGRQRALGSGSSDKLKSSANDGSPQQWFREGLAGPMLSSGMCTEVFQFNVSPTPGSIVPVMSMPNSTSSSDHRRKNSTRVNRPRNRRILHGHPISFDSHALNVAEDRKKVPNAEDVGLESNKSSNSSIVVSVLVDPREAGDVEGESMMGFKSLSRIFVVVLVDGVKYVTYSCVLPLMGSGHHLVTA